MNTFWISRAPHAYRFPVEAVDPILAALVMDEPVRVVFTGEGKAWLEDCAAARPLGQLEFFDDVELIGVGNGSATVAGHTVRWVDAVELREIAGDSLHLQCEPGAVSESVLQARTADVDAMLHAMEQSAELIVWCRP